MFQVDFVFPYVNPKDENWKIRYNYITGHELDSSDTRFRDFSFLRFIFRSISLYAPWIRNVVILVASKTQIPEWVNKNAPNLRIVEHKEFIPELYLPTFNSNTIEMFVPFIPELSEYFIYSNDDLLFLNPSKVTDFFTEEGLMKYAYRERMKQRPEAFLAVCKRTWDIFNYPLEVSFIKQWHGSASPRLLSDCRECFEKYKPQILSSLTMFRNSELNINQYLYGYYSFIKGHTLRVDENQIGTYAGGKMSTLEYIEKVKNCTTPMICINDSDWMTTNMFNKIKNILSDKFPTQSVYEEYV